MMLTTNRGHRIAVGPLEGRRLGRWALGWVRAWWVRVLVLAFAVLACAAALGAQRMRVSMPHDSARAAVMYVVPGDTATVLVDTWNAAGVHVLPTGSGYEGFGPIGNRGLHRCMELVRRDTLARLTIRYRFAEIDGCIPPSNAPMHLTARVGAVFLRDSLHVSRPPAPVPGSELAACTAAHPGALGYASRDTAVAMSILGADGVWIPWTWADMNDVARFSWQGARLILQFSATACAAGWRAWDVSEAARWVSSDTAVAVVLKRAVLSSAGAPDVVFPGVAVLWKKTGTFSLTADWP